ncbi:MAG: NAD(P)-dependent oxidoreductase [Planctomycetota bacterium]
MRIAWIGTGVMGTSMVRRLLLAGHSVTVHTRTRSRAESLLGEGAQWAGSPQEAASGAEAAFTMVGYPHEVREVVLGERGLSAQPPKDQVWVDMSTTDPSLSEEIHRKAESCNCKALDAPVTGGDVGAREGRLSIMVGGHPEIFQRFKPVFEVMGSTVVHHGGPGAGQRAKLSNQIVIAGTMIGVCESLLYARRQNLDPEKLLGSISKGSAGCWTLENLAPRILRGNFEPGFLVDHFVKDMGLVLEDCHRSSLRLPGLELVHRLYMSVQELGHGRKGTHALMMALEHLNRL